MSEPTPAAWCQPGPSPSARALRLEGLRVPEGASLAALLERLPPPPWDVELTEDDPALATVRAAGFEEYARVVVMARPLAGLARPPLLPGVTLGEYRNDDAAAFSALEAAAMDGVASFAEMGQPTGYEGAEGFDIFLVARDADGTLRGFMQTQSPEGWINWFGVDPDTRRLGLAHLLLAETGQRLAEARGTHLAVAVDRDGPAQAFLAALGFQRRGPGLVRLIRRA